MANDCSEEASDASLSCLLSHSLLDSLLRGDTHFSDTLDNWLSVESCRWNRRRISSFLSLKGRFGNRLSLADLFVWSVSGLLTSRLSGLVVPWRRWCGSVASVTRPGESVASGTLRWELEASRTRL